MEELKPMVALNVYLTPEFRKQILFELIDRKETLNPEIRSILFSAIKEKNKVPGFRNSFLAPKGLFYQGLEKVFEKDSKFVSIVMNAWQSLKMEQFIPVFYSLEKLGFDVSEPAKTYEDPERCFKSGWPPGVNYERLHANAVEQLKSEKISSDEIALMTVLTTGILPG